MQWHVHENLCWALDENGKPKVVGVTDDDGNCAPGSVNAGGENPMVHVWIAPHECGPFAALEGHGAGQAATDGDRADQCGHDHGGADRAASPATAAYDPTKPIDLSGVEGVTPEQQAYAENLVAVTLVRLPQWADPAVAEAAGFHSIGDAVTGHEHYVQWDWIDDDVLARSRRAREPRVRTAARRHEEARLGDVHAAAPSPWTTCPTRRPADAVARPRQPLLHRRPRRRRSRGLTAAGGTCRAPLVSTTRRR